MDLVNADKTKKFENNTNSFFMSASVGLYTLIFLEKIENVPPEPIEEGKKDVDEKQRKALFADLTSMISKQLLPAASKSFDKGAEVEVLYGTPGYIYTLVVILHKLGPWGGKNKDVAKLLPKVKQTLIEVVRHLV